jgi:hypothetical protein
MSVVPYSRRSCHVSCAMVQFVFWYYVYSVGFSHAIRGWQVYKECMLGCRRYSFTHQKDISYLQRILSYKPSYNKLHIYFLSIIPSYTNNNQLWALHQNLPRPPASRMISELIIGCGIRRRIGWVITSFWLLTSVFLEINAYWYCLIASHSWTRSLRRSPGCQALQCRPWLGTS